MAKKKQTKKSKRKSSTPRKQKTLLTGEVENPGLVVGLRTVSDHERLLNAETLKDFLTILKEILPYWRQKSVRYEFEADCMLDSMRIQIVLRREMSSRNLPAVPSDFVGVDDWIVSVKRLLRRKPTEDGTSAKKQLPADTKLLGVLAMYGKEHPDKRPTIELMAKKAGVSRKTATNAVVFRATLDVMYPKAPKKGKKYRFDDNRLDLSTGD